MKIGSPIWHCKRTSQEGADIITYSAPTKYVTSFHYITVQPTTLNASKSNLYTTEDYGEHILEGWNMVCNIDKFDGVFTPGDLMYVDGVSPTNGDNGDNANALISRVTYQNRVIYVTLNKIEGR